MHCIHHNISLLPTVIDPVEQEREEPSELALVEDTNPEQDQGKPWFILSHPLIFIYCFLLLYDS
jgi:hypothetical protein